MKSLSRACLIAVASVVAAGCGSASNLEPAEPVDMTKDYSPTADMPGMSPKDMQKANSKAAAGK